MPKSRKHEQNAKAATAAAQEEARLQSYKDHQAKVTAKDARQGVTNVKAMNRASEKAKNKPASDGHFDEIEPEWVQGRDGWDELLTGGTADTTDFDRLVVAVQLKILQLVQ